MKARTHISSSAILSGTIYALTKSRLMAVSAFVSGVFSVGRSADEMKRNTEVGLFTKPSRLHRARPGQR